MKRVAEVVGQRAQLIAGANSARPAEIVELGLFAKRLGYEALMLAAPYYSLPTTAELVDHFKAVAKAVKLPIMLYNFPARTGVDLDSRFYDGVSNVAEIVAIKESSGSIARMYDHIVNRAKKLELVCGADDQALDYFLWGSRSWVAGASNILPAEHVALYDACVKRRDFIGGRAIMDKLLPLFLLMEGGGKYLQYVKHGCELLGLPIGQVRAPLGGLSNEEKANFARLFSVARGAGMRSKAA